MGASGILAWPGRCSGAITEPRGHVEPAAIREMFVHARAMLQRASESEYRMRQRERRLFRQGIKQWRALCCALGILLGLMCSVSLNFWTAPRAYTLELEVRSETRLEIDVEARGRRPKIRGRLIDNVNQGVPQATVTVTISDRSSGRINSKRELITNALGYFEMEETLDEANYLLDVYYSSREGFFQSISRREEFSVSREAFEITAVTPRMISMDGEAEHLVVEVGVVPTNTEGRLRRPQKSALDLTLKIGAGSYERDLRLVGPLWAQVVTIDLDDVEGVGAQPLLLRFEGDDYHAAATLELETFFYKNPRISFGGELIRERDRRGVVLSGRVVSDEGPLEGAKLRVQFKHANEKPWQTAGELRTTEDGMLATFLDEDRLPTGRVLFRLVLQPDEGKDVTSVAVDVRIAPGGISTWASWLLLVLVAVGGVVGLVSVVWSRARAWLQRRQERRKIRAGRGADATAAPMTPPPHVSTEPDSVAGCLVDALEGHPLEGTAVMLYDVARRCEVTSIETGLAGQFHFSGVASGRYELRVERWGYLVGEIGLSTPHDGTWSYFHYNLVPVRLRVRQLYAWLLDHYSPKGGRWGRDTPSELREEMLRLIDRAGGLSFEERSADVGGVDLDRLRALLVERPPLGVLVREVTELLEEIYYSARQYPTRYLEVVEPLIEALRAPLEALGREHLHTHKARSMSSAEEGLE